MLLLSPQKDSVIKRSDAYQIINYQFFKKNTPNLGLMQLLGRTLPCSHILPTEKDITQNILTQTATGIKEEKAVKGTCMHTHSFNTTCHFQPSL